MTELELTQEVSTSKNKQEIQLELQRTEWNNQVLARSKWNFILLRSQGLFQTQSTSHCTAHDDCGHNFVQILLLVEESLQSSSHSYYTPLPIRTSSQLRPSANYQETQKERAPSLLPYCTPNQVINDFAEAHSCILLCLCHPANTTASVSLTAWSWKQPLYIFSNLRFKARTKGKVRTKGICSDYKWL